MSINYNQPIGYNEAFMPYPGERASRDYSPRLDRLSPALAAALGRPNAANVFLAEITAGLWCDRWVQHDTNIWKFDCGTLPVFELRRSSVLVRFTVDYATMAATAGKAYYDGRYIYLHYPELKVFEFASGTANHYIWQATCRFHFSTAPKNFNGAYYDPRIQSVPNLSIRIEPQFSGVGQIGGGRLSLINSDGFFDGLTRLQWDAGTVTLRMGSDVPQPPSEMAYADYSIIGTWRVERVSRGDNAFDLDLREYKTNLEREIPFETYNQTDYPQLAARDIGKVIPLAWGKIYGASPTVINAEERIFKVAGHAVRDFTAVRLNESGTWLEVPFKSVDRDHGEFQLGPEWDGNQQVSVDFEGRRFADGNLMENPADVMEDLLAYVGETSLNNPSFYESWRALYIGRDRFGSDQHAFAPSIHLTDRVKAIDIAGKLNEIAGSYLFVGLDGKWVYQTFTPGPVVSAEFTDTDIIDGSYGHESDSGETVSQITVNFAKRKQDGWKQQVTLSRNHNRYLHRHRAVAAKEADVALSSRRDAVWYAQRFLTTEAEAAEQISFSVPWQGFFLLPGDPVRVQYSRDDINDVVEIVEARYDLVNARVALKCGNLRGWGDSFGFWLGDAASYALNFPGGAYVQADGPTLTNSAMTIECWVRNAATSGDRAIFDRYVTGASGQEQFACYWRSGALWLNGRGTSTAYSPSLPQNGWTHIAATLDSTGYIQIFLNGVRRNASQGSPPLASTGKLHIGFVPNWTWTGDMRDFRIWDHVRSETQIQQFMHANLDGNESGLLSWYPMNEGAGSVLNDLGPANKDGSFIGTLGWSALTVGDGVLPDGGSLAWNGAWDQQTKEWALQHSGHWTDDNGFASTADPDSFLPSRWW